VRERRPRHRQRGNPGRSRKCANAQRGRASVVDDPFSFPSRFGGARQRRASLRRNGRPPRPVPQCEHGDARPNKTSYRSRCLEQRETRPPGRATQQTTKRANDSKQQPRQEVGGGRERQLEQ
jgi:hypothetical protein